MHALSQRRRIATHVPDGDNVDGGSIIIDVINHLAEFCHNHTPISDSALHHPPRTLLPVRASLHRNHTRVPQRYRVRSGQSLR